MTRDERLSAQDALAMFALVFVLYIAVGAVTPASTVGLVAQQLIALGLPALLFVRARGLTLAGGLGLRMPRLPALIGAALIGVSFWYPNLWLVDTIVSDPGALEEVERQLGWTADPVWVRLAAIAILPAVCEELLLRGAIARGLAPALGLLGGITISAILFASLHMPPVRMIPAGAFGLLLGYAAIATDSVVPCILMHFLNNLVAAIVLPSLPDFTAWLGAHEAASGLVTVAMTATGVALLWSSRDFRRR